MIYLMHQNKLKQWWSDRLHKYPHLAEASSSAVRPETAEIFGPNMSVVFVRGLRTFAFRNKSDRDRFCKKLGARQI